MTGGASIGAAIADAAARLAACGIEAPRREARLLVALAAELDDAAVLGYPEREIAGPARTKLERMLARRLAHEPVSRIAGRREFWSLEFALSPETLDPRPDSETVVAAALERVADRAAPLAVLDLGTGTGCMLLALLSELPSAWGIGVDLSPGAAALARQNAAATGLKSRAFFAVGRWGEGVGGGFDLVVANPPYIASEAIAGLAPEVARWEPRLALDGGSDGLRGFREIAADLRRLVKPAGFACIEVGDGQADAAARIFARAGLDEAGRRRDLSGIERCLVLERPKKTVGMRTLPV
ncbi:MAG TPA: peptide chain release factor N(5)-glutamine methyltransferase [Stellaceae bacterium]|nr:peptide chain release factor N(5)-glutamine methyltransferase [Stellaceae bacterium]